MKKQYIELELTIVEFENDDIVTTSGLPARNGMDNDVLMSELISGGSGS